MEGITMWRKIFGGGTKAPSVAAETLPSDLAVERERMPRHIAIVMDGNGRWAKAQGRSRSAGHVAGPRTHTRFVGAASDGGVVVLTF